MVPRIRAFDAKPGNLTSIPGTHVVEEKKPVLQVVPGSTHVHVVCDLPTLAHIKKYR